MTLKNTQLKEKIISSQECKIGTLYFLENMVFSEIKEGVHFDLKTFRNYLKKIVAFYGDTKPFGYVCNRINAFSMEALDFPKFSNILKNAKIFAAISNSSKDKMNMEIEKRFSKIPYKDFENTVDSYNYVNEYIEQLKQSTSSKLVS